MAEVFKALSLSSVSLQLGALLCRLVTPTWATSGRSPELRPWPEVSGGSGACEGHQLFEPLYRR